MLRFFLFLALVVLWLLAAPPVTAALVLQLRLLEGESGSYPAGSRLSRPITVEVTDELGQPVEGATVTFQLPENGAGGTFPSGMRNEAVRTKADGRATIAGIQWNKVPGTFALRITAAKDLARAGVVSRQNLTGPGPIASPAPPSSLAVSSSPAPVSPPASLSPTAPSSSRAPASDVASRQTTAPSSALIDLVRSANSGSADGPPDAGGEGTFHTPHNFHWKWILAGVAVAGAGAFFALHQSGASTSASGNLALCTITASVCAGALATTPPQIGTPVIVVGHP